MDLAPLPGYRLAVAAHYDATFRAETPDHVLRRMDACSRYLDLIVAALGEPRATHVDLGCGGGLAALALARSAPDTRITGIDASPHAISLAQATAARLGLHADFLVGDAEAPGGPYASGTALSLLNLMPDKHAALQAWRTAISGPLVITDGFALSGASARGSGAMTRADFDTLAASLGWRMTRRLDITAHVASLAARGAWSWPEYVREGFAYDLVRLD